MAAACAVPGVFDRVKISIDGKEKAFADGGLFCNSPDASPGEARRLYPSGPVGMVLILARQSKEQTQ